LQAEAALDTLNKKDIGEAKSLKKPPPGVDDITAVVIILLEGNPKDKSWTAAQKLMNNVDKFMERLKNFKSAHHSRRRHRAFIAWKMISLPFQSACYGCVSRECLDSHKLPLRHEHSALKEAVLAYVYLGASRNSDLVGSPNGRLLTHTRALDVAAVQ
jgi:hypothetical protein